MNTVGSYKCVCREGYELDLISGRCKDVNECELGTHDCDQKCVNTAGSYYCRCDEGFTKGKDLKLGLGGFDFSRRYEMLTFRGIS